MISSGPRTSKGPLLPPPSALSPGPVRPSLGATFASGPSHRPQAESRPSSPYLDPPPRTFLGHAPPPPVPTGTRAVPASRESSSAVRRIRTPRWPPPPKPRSEAVPLGRQATRPAFGWPSRRRRLSSSCWVLPISDGRHHVTGPDPSPLHTPSACTLPLQTLTFASHELTRSDTTLCLTRRLLTSFSKPASSTAHRSPLAAATSSSPCFPVSLFRLVGAWAAPPRPRNLETPSARINKTARSDCCAPPRATQQQPSGAPSANGVAAHADLPIPQNLSVLSSSGRRSRKRRARALSRSPIVSRFPRPVVALRFFLFSRRAPPSQDVGSYPDLAGAPRLWWSGRPSPAPARTRQLRLAPWGPSCVGTVHASTIPRRDI